jgi:hypothetical protein
MNQKQILLPVFIVLLAIAAANAQTYVTIDVPGAGSGTGQGTFAQTVSDTGIVYGNYVGTNSVAHGFLRSTQGKYITFDVAQAGTGAGQEQCPSA